MIKDNKNITDEDLNQVSGGKVDVSSKKSIGSVTILADRIDFYREPVWDCFCGDDGFKGETYQIYAIKQGDGKKWFLLDNGYYAICDPAKISYTFTF